MTTRSASPATPPHLPIVLGWMTRANLAAGTVRNNLGAVLTSQLTKSAGHVIVDMI